MGKISTKYLPNGPTSFVVPFFLFALLQLLSFPLGKLFGDDLFSYVEGIVGPRNIETAYLLSIAVFLLLLLGYFFLPCHYWARKFQVRRLVMGDESKTIRLWYFSAAAVISLCFVAFVRTGFKVPLFLSVNTTALDLVELRFASVDAIGTEIIVLCQYIFLPLATLAAFDLSKETNRLLKLATTFLYLLVGLFTLERSTLVIPILVYFSTRLSLKPISWNAMLRPVILCLLIVGTMVAYTHFNETTDKGDVFLIFISRLLHGQWLGLPAYLWHFDDAPVQLSALIHPYLKVILGLTNTITPGSELMQIIYPAAMDSDTVGNIPTLFVGEAYAIGGWALVILSVLHVILFMAVCAWIFTKLPKTPMTCLLYGIITVKVSMGIVLGYSMFIFSLLTLLVLFILMYILLKASSTPFNFLK